MIVMTKTKALSDGSIMWSCAMFQMCVVKLSSFVKGDLIIYVNSGLFDDWQTTGVLGLRPSLERRQGFILTGMVPDIPMIG